ncbi:hypothetical protein C900_01795 [Fulvivirga imtechensis AK7]|uniref:Deoxyribose-phosphate aldolase n=1 Tax=Fulvivirga imtechensis AK7 TaxID=1237149 RepID=L8JTE7_9BACT|nr:DUF6503 family protein [Fulvivirga imtechensis]ELR72241.1 hypothetical protein C900_01795 [Fulvivirga imtechensis AK7]
MKKILMALMVLGAIGCDNKEKDPEVIAFEAIEAAGGPNYDSIEVEFTFRDKEYGAKYASGRFEYVRLFKDSTGLIRDVLNNDGFYREINGAKADIPDSMASKYANSVNSVIYFAMLPKGLNDPAVNKAYLGKATIKGKEYHKIKVTFEQQGGGTDYEDEFIYWIGTEDKRVDYLAYKYLTEGGGMRFREAYNERFVGGIRFVDYINYKPKAEITLEAIGEAFVNSDLEELSRIELKGVRVNEL